MSKKERLSEFNRNNILAAAKQLFLDKGITQTTMDDIAKTADYSKSTIYVYFENKEEIFNYIVLEYFTFLRDGLSYAVDSASDFTDGYFAICNTVVKFYDDYPMYFDSILGDIKVSVDETDPIPFQIYLVGEQINEIIENYFKACMTRGEIRADLDHLPQTIFALWASICGIISLANKKEEYITLKMSDSKEEFMQNGFNVLLRSVLP